MHILKTWKNRLNHFFAKNCINIKSSIQDPHREIRMFCIIKWSWILFVKAETRWQRNPLRGILSDVLLRRRSLRIGWGYPLFLGIIDKDYTKRCKSCKSKWNVSSRECKWNVNVAKMTVITFHLTLYSFYHAHLSILPLNSTFQFIKKRVPENVGIP